MSIKINNISRKDIDTIVDFLKNVNVPASVGSDLIKIATVLEKAEDIVAEVKTAPLPKVKPEKTK